MIDTIIGVFGLLIGIVSFVYAIYQRNELNSLRRYRIKKLRADLRNCIAIVTESYRVSIRSSMYGITDTEAIGKIRAIHSSSAVLIRSIFQELSEIDLPYDEKRLCQYVDSGLITSKWMWAQARSFIVNPKTNIEIPDLPEESIDWMRLESGTQRDSEIA